MKRSKNNRRAFYVVQFIELPFEGIDDYVCVPYTWLKVRRPSDHKAAVAYPKDEDPFDTRDRVKRKERYDDEWRSYMAAVKYESDTYKDAEYWIATRNDYGPLVEKESTISDTPSRFRLNNKLRNANQSNSSQFNDNPGKPLPRISIMQPALSEPEKQPDGKRLKLDEAAQSSSAVVNDASTDPGRSKRGQSIIIQDIQSMECAQTEETAAATNGDESTTPRTRISQRHLSNNPAAALIIAAEPSTLAEQTTQPNQHDNQEQMLNSGSSLSNFQPRIENVRSIATNYNDYERHVNDESNNELTSHHLPDSLRMSAHFYNHINARPARRLVPIQEPAEKRICLINITKNLALASQNPFNLMDQTGSPSTHSVAEQSSVVTQSRSQDSP